MFGAGLGVARPEGGTQSNCEYQIDDFQSGLCSFGAFPSNQGAVSKVLIGGVGCQAPQSAGYVGCAIETAPHQRHPEGCELPPSLDLAPFVELIGNVRTWMRASSLQFHRYKLARWDKFSKNTGKQLRKELTTNDGLVGMLRGCTTGVNKKNERLKVLASKLEARSPADASAPMQSLGISCR
ncbi:hypothetical protein BOTBODRAFT_46836 [Botryobasidium botryosum FD-172 SS1]|uniref:Uncharacterized protein n=1 Tax=Botryobasidium botryosum (strain FD-172 SS1) TaxID=930990 RepID=A0A067M822_BOTB1|nr:hypothetical protein BOTBODRAFT_46836 [Botryobasidium botryosum FD-172 SS1]